ncbi:MAG: tRNA (adenosine(37)-N6)-threonylcarbamoyltransferase complex ATPase subunit type 1 TsaE [Eubacteriales bacterium]
MIVIEVNTHSEVETEQVGEKLGKLLKPGSVVALFGDMGAGKTAFVRGLVRATGFNGRVTSPTYSIVNEYNGPIPVFHFDMYRLRGDEEFYELGWEDYLVRGGICVVEWSERIIDALPENAIHVTLKALGDERLIRIEENLGNAHSSD